MALRFSILGQPPRTAVSRIIRNLTRSSFIRIKTKLKFNFAVFIVFLSAMIADHMKLEFAD
jgi:hypothetical protein